MKVAFIFGPSGANEDPAGMISFERNSNVWQVGLFKTELI